MKYQAQGGVGKGSGARWRRCRGVMKGMEVLLRVMKGMEVLLYSVSRCRGEALVALVSRRQLN